ncbi:MAG: ribosome biogenesis factor YjgA [Aequoribacter sp.]|jgi:ribosome-associated protein|uniref:ribosome biogenesis factor YjgA n=1 Tax=Aequoribacter sp. TaxID=2847771 RepID=UPI003C5E2632
MQDEEWDDWDDLPPSKSAVKRQLAELTDLARVLVELPQKRLDQIPIDDETLQEGIELARRITANSGRKRQIQFLGKRLRSLDTTAIVAALNREHETDKEAAHKHHTAERWRDEIMADGMNAINAFVGEFQQAERSQLRGLWQQAQKERSKGAPPASYRKLYKAIFSALDA